MRISINDDAKAILFWITSEEALAPDIKDTIVQKAAHYTSNKKYKIVTFISGHSDYLENTKALLSHNVVK